MKGEISNVLRRDNTNINQSVPENNKKVDNVQDSHKNINKANVSRNDCLLDDLLENNTYVQSVHHHRNNIVNNNHANHNQNDDD
jgi:hypothetical protein